MKFFTYAALLTGTAFAQSITGVPVLKGALKTKTQIGEISTVCKVKVDKIKNIMEEDSYGFPGYQVRIEASLDGKNSDHETVIRFNQDYTLTNFWNENGRIVARDFDYYSIDGANLTIKQDGRLKSFSFPFNGRKITCSF